MTTQISSSARRSVRRLNGTHKDSSFLQTSAKCRRACFLASFLRSSSANTSASCQMPVQVLPSIEVQEVPPRILDKLYTPIIGCFEQSLHIVFADINISRISEFNQVANSAFVQIENLYLVFPSIFPAGSKKGLKVGAERDNCNCMNIVFYSV